MEVKNMQLASRGIIHAMTFVVACLPLACGYVMEGGDIQIWLARIDEIVMGLKNGYLPLFPSAELTVAQQAQYSALDSNLWLFLPGFMRMIGMSVTATYRMYLLFLNVLGFYSAKELFDALFEDKNTASIAVLLYMTSPYRLYICYDKADFGMVAAWSLIPFLWSEVYHLYGERITWRRFTKVAVFTALIGYANVILLLVALGIVLLWCLWNKDWSSLLPVMVGGGLFLPGAVYWLRYMIKGGMGVWNLPLGSITKKGYSFGQFFSGWTYAADKPGVGLGIFVALFLLLWCCMIQKRYAFGRQTRFFMLLAVLTGAFSMKLFLWDMVQRLGMPFLRMVGMMETPGILFGFTTIVLAGFGAYGVACTQQEQKQFVKIGFPVIVIMASLGNAIYICNMLTYTRMPLFI